MRQYRVSFCHFLENGCVFIYEKIENSLISGHGGGGVRGGLWNVGENFVLKGLLNRNNPKSPSFAEKKVGVGIRVSE